MLYETVRGSTTDGSARSACEKSSGDARQRFTAKRARDDFDRTRQLPNFAGWFTRTADALRHVPKVLESGV